MITSFSGEYRFLSNFYPSPLRLHGREYPTVEHAYQAMKTNSKRARREIAAAATPGVAKRLGRRVELRADWEEVKIPIMLNLLEMKFHVDNGDFANRLIATRDQLLEEGNTWGDTFWGTVDRQGENWLGKLLMLQRAMLRAR